MPTTTVTPAPAQVLLQTYPPLVPPFKFVDNFNRADAGGLGTQWEQVYSGPGGGTFKTDNGRARWFPSGTGEREVLNRFVGVNQTQILAVSGRPKGGTFKLSFEGYETAPIAWDATPEQVQAALEALPNVNPGDISVTANS